MPFTFDWTINLGVLIQGISFFALALGFLYKMNMDNRLIKVDINYLKKSNDALKDAFTQLGTILTQVAVQDARISMIEKNVDDLRHGRGFVGK